MNTTRVRDAGPVLTTRNKVGLALAGLISLINVPSVLEPTPGGEVGPPFVVMLADTVVGLVGLVAVIIAWRSGSRTAIRVAAACLVVALVTALPALFVEVPAFVKVLVAVFTLITLATLVLMFSGDRRRMPVLD